MKRRSPLGDHRYPLAPLAAAMRLTEPAALAALGVSGTQQRERRTLGLTRLVADNMAVKAGMHPYEVWPEMADHDIAAAESTLPGCKECSTTFVSVHPLQTFCTPRCRKRWWARETQRRWRATPEGAELNRQRRRAYYAENAAYERARERRAYRAKVARAKGVAA